MMSYSGPRVTAGYLFFTYIPSKATVHVLPPSVVDSHS
jgi:hypothetical protein